MSLKTITVNFLAVLTMPIYFIARIISAAIFRSREEYEKHKAQGGPDHAP